MFSREDGGERIYTNRKVAASIKNRIMLRNHTGAYGPPRPWLCTNFKDTSASTELPSSCHQQQNFFKNSSGSNLTSPQASNITKILLLNSYQHLPIVKLKSFSTTLFPVRNYFPEVGISSCHVTSALKLC